MTGKERAMIRIVPSYVAGLLLGLLALVFCVGAFRLGFWGDDGPGPGLLPLVVGALLMPMIVIALREPIPEDESSFKIPPLLAIAMMLAYALALPRSGFVPATLVLLLLWVRGFYRQSWFRAVACAACLTALGLFIFSFLLKVPMPMFLEWS
jgi:putative tricarboxylic transport membrane protein